MIDYTCLGDSYYSTEVCSRSIHPYVYLFRHDGLYLELAVVLIPFNLSPYYASTSLFQFLCILCKNLKLFIIIIIYESFVNSDKSRGFPFSKGFIKGTFSAESLNAFYRERTFTIFRRGIVRVL